MNIDIALLPKETKEMNLSDRVCIVLDIFRATTTIITALSNECKEIIPVLSVEDAQALAKEIGPALLAGERQSIPIEGYHFGNSPFEFSKDKVKKQRIIMTTTNGTIAIKATTGAYRTLIGSFLNAKAVCKQAKEEGKDILIVCAGTDGYFSLEDSLCAGLLVKLLTREGVVEMSDSAHGALLMYNMAQDTLLETAVQGRNGKRLYDLQRMADVEYCLTMDTVEIVPEYKDGSICLTTL